MTDEIGDADTSGLERLLKGSGSRIQPPPEIEASVRVRTQAVWREVVSARKRRRATWTLAAAAAVGALAIALWFGDVGLPAPSSRLQLAAIDGEAYVQQGPGRRWHPLERETELREGASIRTASGQVALDVGGLSVRLDRGSRLLLTAENRFELRSGAVYVDAGPGGRSVPLTMQTPNASVRHVGTQYEVRADRDLTRVRVREGRVEVTAAGGVATADAGEQLEVSARAIARSALDPRPESWKWILAVAPSYSIEGRSLSDFLAWASRELGIPVRYANAEASEQAQRTILSGSIEGMTIEQAIDTVIATTRLRIEHDEQGYTVRAP